MRYLSLFAGIEAATQAWHPLDWEPVGFAEIEPFPCALLQHHYPDVPNLGSVTDITDQDIRALGPIDLVVGGSPCQDLSVAGKRAGLAGERSGLFHEQMRIFHAAQHFCGARYCLWENVPGAFSSHGGRDFAVVVSTMAGAEFGVPRNGWQTAGAAVGENGLVEWRVLDAQYVRTQRFPRAVPQRRRRVFALLDTGDWAGRAPILLERESLRGDPPPSREAGQATAASTRPSLTASGRGVERTGESRGQDPVIAVSHSLRAEGFDASEDGTGRGTPLVPVAGSICAHSFTGGSGGRPEGAVAGHFVPVLSSGQANAELTFGYSPALNCNRDGAPIAFHPTQNPISGSVCHSLGANSQATAAIAYDILGVPATQGAKPTDVHTSLRARAPGQSEANTTTVVVQPVAFQQNTRDEVRLMGGDGQIAGALAAEPGVKQQNYIAQTVAIRTANTSANGHGISEGVSHTPDQAQGQAVATPMAVRRLTPVECERLMGMPDNYTRIPYRNKPAEQCPDGPRYKALGNSIAVNCLEWIGERLEQVKERPS